MAAVVLSIPETLRSTVNCNTSDIPLNDVRSQKDTSASPNTIDELLRKRAETHPNQALLAYPKTFNGAADFVVYTARDLDRFADEVARKLQSNGLKPAVSHLLRY
jgi:acyl-CoA synthetase (AMP-forming)/AMP-acid ligase II